MNLFRLLLVVIIAGFNISCNSKSSSLQKFAAINYPSGSGMAFYKEKIYLIGDDAASMIIMDTAFNRLDSVSFFQSQTKRIPKDVKADLESIALLHIKRAPYLMLTGSGSASPQRDSAWLYNILSGARQGFSLDTFFNRLKAAGINELNIEGATAYPHGIILSNRGNKKYKKNHLIFTSRDFWMNQEKAPLSVSTVGINADTSVFNGVSGLEYSEKGDRLILTVSTEETFNALEDGAIGKSYIWIVNDITGKRNISAMNADKIIDLEMISGQMKGNKIESVCIVNESRKHLELVLVSDDDKGGSGLFKMSLDLKHNK